MPIYRVQSFKQIGTGRPWTNVWHVLADDFATVQAAVEGTLCPAETHILSDTVTIVRALISDPATHEFLSLAIGSAGLAAGVGLLPLFNTIRIILAVDALGRPDSKYWRGLVGEANSENGLISSATQTNVDAVITGLIGDMAGVGASLVDDAGNFVTVASVQQAIQERQLHRRRRPA